MLSSSEPAEGTRCLLHQQQWPQQVRYQILPQGWGDAFQPGPITRAQSTYIPHSTETPGLAGEGSPTQSSEIRKKLYLQRKY